MKTITLGVSALALLLSAGLADAQSAKSGGGAAGNAPAAGAETGAGNGEQPLPPGGGKGAPGGKPVPGATGGTASPGLSATPGAKPTPGEKPAGENAGVEPQKPGQPKAAGEQPAGAGKAGQPNAAAAKRGAPPKLDEAQRGHVREAVRGGNFRPVHVDFNIGIGVAVPRTVVLEPLPPDIVTYVPDYEGYRFFVVPGQLVIVDPDTLDIVAVIPI